MTDDEDDLPVQAGHYVLLALVMLMITGAMLLSARPILLASVPDVVHVADIPSRVDPEDLRRYIWSVDYTVPKTRLRPQIAMALAKPRAELPKPQLGYSVRQISLLGLPLFAHRELGYVIYVDTPAVFQMAPLGDEGMALLRKQAGTDLTQGWIFPFWTFSWGWIAIASVAAFGLLERRRQERRRVALGLI